MNPIGRVHGGIALALLFVAAQAQAAPGFELSWTAPSICPNARSVERQILRLAPSPPARERPLEVRGTVRQTERGFALELELRDGELTGRRSFEGESCAEVVGAAAVTIALSLSSDTAEALEPRPDESVPTPAAADATSATPSDTKTKPTPTAAEATSTSPNATRPAVAPHQPPEPAASSARRWRIAVSAPVAVAGVGFLSEPSVGLAAGLAFEAEPFRLSLHGTWYLDLEPRLGSSPDRGANVSRRTAQLAACRWWGHKPIQVAPCALLGLQRLVARGVGPDLTPSRADFTWVSLGPGVLARALLSHAVAIGGGAGLEIQTARPNLVIEGLGEVEQIGTVETIGFVGAEWIF